MTARKGFFIALTTALANWLLYYKLVEHYYFSDIVFITSALLVSLAIHELGHAIVLRVYDVRTYIVFAVIGAVTLPYKEDREKFLSLRPQTKMFMALAGVIANTVLVSISFLLYALHIIDHYQLVVMAYMGAILILPNLLPLSLIISLDCSLFFPGADRIRALIMATLSAIPGAPRVVPRGSPRGIENSSPVDVSVLAFDPCRNSHSRVCYPSHSIKLRDPTKPSRTRGVFFQTLNYKTACYNSFSALFTNFLLATQGERSMKAKLLCFRAKEAITQYSLV